MPGMFPSDIHCIHFDELDSTNSYAMEHLGELEHHSLIISDVQNAGRGRLERSWDSSVRGNLYMSLVEKRLPEDISPANLTQLMAVAVRAAAVGHGYDLRIKWPNDLMLDGGKAGGILSETRFRQSGFTGMVIGVGVNISAVPGLDGNPLYPPVCFRSYAAQAELPAPPSRDAFAADILNEYLQRYPNFLHRGFISIGDEYRSALSDYRRPVFIEADGFSQEHTFLGINDKGEIIVRTPAGAELCIQAGDVR